MDGLDLVGSEILVELLFQCKSCRGVVVRVETQLAGHAAPGEFLIGDLVISTVGDDMLEYSKKIEMGGAHFRLRVEGCPAVRVEGSELLDEFFVLGGSLDYVVR